MSYAPYSPVVPRGASAYSFVCLLRRFNSVRSAGRTRLKELGLSSGSFSETATIGTVSKVCCNEVIPSNQLLIEHTVFGFYSLSLEKNERDKWIEAIVQKRDLNRLRAWVKSVTSSAIDSNGLRFCPDCTSAEKREVGVSTWRVINQLPFVRRCAIHGAALKSACANCKQALDKGRAYRLPEDGCKKCGGYEFEDVDQIYAFAYKRVVELCFEAFATQPDDYRPKPWIHRMCGIAQHFGGVDQAATFVKQSVCAGWGISNVNELSDLLEFKFPPRFIEGLVAGNALNQPLLAQMIVHEALERVGFWKLPEGTTHSLNYASADDHRVKSDRSRFKKMSNQLATHGVPYWAAKRMLNGASLGSLATELGIDRRKLRSIVQLAIEPHELAFFPHQEKKASCSSSTRGMTTEQKAVYYKAVVTKIVQDNPKITRSKLLSRTLAMTWLYRNDPKWVSENTPKGNRGRPRKSTDRDEC